MAVSILSLVLVALHVLPLTALRNLKPAQRGVKWLEKGRTVLVWIYTPDLPLWNEKQQIGEDIPTALILNFTLIPDNRTLLLQDQPFFPLPNPHSPPRLSAPQTSQTLHDFKTDRSPNFEHAPIFDLDYDRIAHPRDDPSIHYYNYNPTLTLNLLGAGIAGYNALLRDERQPMVKITLKDWNTVGRATTDPPNHNLEITEVKLPGRREADFVSPDDLKECTLWSWRCSDFGDTPWYRYVFRQNFDEHGRIGSFRHMLVQRWHTLNERLGYWGVVLLIQVVACMVLSPFGYALFKGIKWIMERHQSNVEAASPWAVDEEEAEGLLFEEGDEMDVGDPKEIEEKDAVLEKQVEESEAEGLHKPLPTIPEKTGDVSGGSEKP